MTEIAEVSTKFGSEALVLIYIDKIKILKNGNNLLIILSPPSLILTFILEKAFSLIQS